MDDDTRQVEKHGTDEVFEVGDASIINSSGAHRPPPQKPSPMPWLLWVFTLLGAGAFFYFVHMPLEASEADALSNAAKLDKELSAVKSQLALVQVDLNNLRDKSASQEKTLEDQASQLKELTGTRDELELKLKEEISRGDVLVKQVKGELVVDLADQILFPSGAADMNDKGKEVLRRVGEAMFKATGKVIQVGGHTDNTPISEKLKKEFPSNWELATTRALNVVHFLEDEVKVPGERLVVSGFGQYRPIAKNNSKDGRKKNRRIEVILLERKK
jgi:chemotaxis protein MotB